MLMIYDIYGWPLHSPSISADSCSPTPSLQAHLKQETSDYTGVLLLTTIPIPSIMLLNNTI